MVLKFLNSVFKLAIIGQPVSLKSTNGKIKIQLVAMEEEESRAPFSAKNVRLVQAIGWYPGENIFAHSQQQSIRINLSFKMSCLLSTSYFLIMFIFFLLSL